MIRIGNHLVLLFFFLALDMIALDCTGISIDENVRIESTFFRSPDMRLEQHWRFDIVIFHF
jgi:hypothetical protein